MIYILQKIWCSSKDLLYCNAYVLFDVVYLNTSNHYVFWNESVNHVFVSFGWSEECERFLARTMSARGKTTLKYALIFQEVGFGSINVPSSSGFYMECNKSFCLKIRVLENYKERKFNKWWDSNSQHQIFMNEQYLSLGKISVLVLIFLSTRNNGEKR